VSDGNAARGSGASMMEMTKATEQIFFYTSFFAAVK
jgi:hypothetical protein